MIHTVTKQIPNETYSDWVVVSSGSPDDNLAAVARAPNGKASPRSVPLSTANAQNSTQMLSLTNPNMSKVVCCKNPKNLFCFVCGLYILSHHKRSIMTRPLLEAYESYFKVRTSKENYLQGPPSVCNVCNNALLRWKNGMCPKPELPFAIPMLWSQPADHATDCYFCLTCTTPSGEKKSSLYSNAPIEYPILRSAIRPKLFASRPAGVPHTRSASDLRRISVPPSGIDEQDNGVSSISIRTYAGHSVKPKEQHPVGNGLQPVVRRSLPAQKTVSSTVQKHSIPVAGTLKRKIEPNDDGTGSPLTYGMTKVRLRNSEPTIVLEKCKKLLPSNTAAIIRRPMTPNSANAPRILNVFSLNKDAVNCVSEMSVICLPETKPPTPPPEIASVLPQTIVKIEIEDDVDDDDVAEYNVVVPATKDSNDESTTQLDLKTSELQKIEPGVAVKNESEQNEPTYNVPKQTVVKIEPQKSSPTLTARQQKVQVTHGRMGFINVKDLATTSSTMTIGGSNAIKFKLSPPLDGAATASFPTKVVPAVKEEAASPEKKLQPSRYCFINMKDMPSLTANNVERTVKITASPIVATQPQQSQPQKLTDSTVAAATLKYTPVVAVVSEQGDTKVLQVPDQDDGPHRITQSELILLLRELELPKAKSAVLIDRLKRWNLLAIEMVGTNRNRPIEMPQPSSASTSSSTSSALSEKTATTLASMKEIQIHNTRATGLRQSTGPPILTSSTSSRTSTTTVGSKPPLRVPVEQNGGPTKPTLSTSSAKVVTAVVKNEKALPPRRQATTTTTTTTTAASVPVSEEKPVQQRSGSTITTRSATGAIVKQNITSSRVK
ncbi:mucin-5AC-like [Anopheles maculipalpis]|uniref:mucin-5AC-like n=1 Tax=Anopheles maculipalpis TaxID=1496333 RepID=UPI002158E8A2|nr:mucin-5AC-like [Anopheles maculipalpis]